MTKNPKNKGSQFERDIARKLSLWWTESERDDVFWRTDSSGGRSTQRAKKGQTTANSAGDISALDPRGNDLLKCFTIEIKRGYSNMDLLSLLDRPKNKSNIFLTWWTKLNQEAIANKSSPMLIFKRDRSNICVVLPGHLFTKIEEDMGFPLIMPRLILSIEGQTLVIFPFDMFTSIVPFYFKERVKNYEVCCSS